MKSAIYKHNKIGNLIDFLVFEAEDFESGNDALPKYIRPKYDENNNILPIELNKVGGYCYHDKDRMGYTFIEYRYPETPYDEVIDFEEKVSINNPCFDCGWISPEGDTYWCLPRGHSEIADIISKEKYDEWNGERSLEDKGWVKIYHESEMNDDFISFFPEGVFYNTNNLPNQKQISVIKKIGRFTEEFKDYLRMNKKYMNDKDLNNY